jgi:hypothetical protein
MSDDELNRTKNSNLSAAKKAKFDEFYTQYHDIEREMNAYLDLNKDVFRDKTILLPCDDPEWSNFTKYFAQNFERLGLKKLISTSYAPDSKPQELNLQLTLFETGSPKFDKAKARANGKIYTLTRDATGDKKINVEDLEWEYLKGDGDFRSIEVTALRDEADVVITNPPFSLFREFLDWIVSAGKNLVIIGSMNAITYREVFPLIKENKIWLGNGFKGGASEFISPRVQGETSGGPLEGSGLVKFGNVVWFTNLEHGRRHQPLTLMTEDDNMKFSKHKEVKGVGYHRYQNYEAIDVPFTDAIPSDYRGTMGVPISFLSKYNPEQFVIIGNGQTMANELGIEPVGDQFVEDYYAQGNTGSINPKWNNLVYRIGNKVVIPYQRILIRHKRAA